LDGHLVGFEELIYWEEYEDHIYYGGAMSIIEEKEHEFALYLEVYDR